MQREIDQFLRQLTNSGRSANTCSAYRTDLRSFLAFLRQSQPPVTGWQDITDVHLAGYVAHLEDQGSSPATITRKSVVLNRFFGFLGSSLRIPRRPTARARSHSHSHRNDSHSPGILEPADIAALLAQAAQATTPAARRDQALLALLCDTGARASELTGVNVGDFDLNRQEIVLDAGGPKERTQTLQSATVEAISEYLASSSPTAHPAWPDAPLFRNQQGGRLTRQAVWLIVRRYAAALPNAGAITPRTLRRSISIHKRQTADSSLTLDGVPVATD